MVQRTLKIKLYRPKLGIATKTLIALSASFWLPVLALMGVLFMLLNVHFDQEATTQIKFGLKGAKTIYQERQVVLQQLMGELANQPEVQASFARRDGDQLQAALHEFGRGLEYLSLLAAVDEDQHLIARYQSQLCEVAKVLALSVIGNAGYHCQCV